MNYQILDNQMRMFSEKLKIEVGLRDDEIGKVATTVAAEVRFLNHSAKETVLAASPVLLANRLEELISFQAWMDLSSKIVANPAISRAQVIVQNYICFVYLSEACFRALRKVAPPGSLTRRCCQFLTDNPTRAFRNAIAQFELDISTGFFWIGFLVEKGF
jgi:hypothetical protein